MVSISNTVAIYLIVTAVITSFCSIGVYVYVRRIDVRLSDKISDLEDRTIDLAIKSCESTSDIDHLYSRLEGKNAKS